MRWLGMFPSRLLMWYQRLVGTVCCMLRFTEEKSGELFSLRVWCFGNQRRMTMGLKIESIVVERFFIGLGLILLLCAVVGSGDVLKSTALATDCTQGCGEDTGACSGTNATIQCDCAYQKQGKIYSNAIVHCTGAKKWIVPNYP